MQRVITVVHMSGTMYMQLTVIKLCNINIYSVHVHLYMLLKYICTLTLKSC